MLLSGEKLDCNQLKRFGALITRFSLVTEGLVVAFGDVDVRELPTIPVVAPEIHTQVRRTCHETLVRLLYKLILIRCEGGSASLALAHPLETGHLLEMAILVTHYCLLWVQDRSVDHNEARVSVLYLQESEV